VRQSISRLSAGVGTFLAPLAALSAAVTAAYMPPEFIRHYAVEAPLPVFPAHLGRADFNGRVVVEVVISEGGGPISSVKVLESTVPALASATASALARWRFAPFADAGTSGRGRPGGRPLSTRLVFYFAVKAGHGYVTDAALEMLDLDRKRHEESQRGPGGSGQQPR